MSIEFGVLGPLEIRRDGAIVPLRSRKQRLLLADLLVHRSRVVSTDVLIDDLWQGSPPRTAKQTLQQHVYGLRGVLGDDADALVVREPGYVLEADLTSVDSVRFERLLAEARTAQQDDPARAAGLASEGLALWRGPPLSDFTYEPFAQAEIAHLEELRWDAVELRIDAELELGREDLVAELESLMVIQPLREHLYAQLMLAEYRGGRQGDALAVYQRARDALLEELGVEPGDELRDLQARILNRDPGLIPRSAGTRATRRSLATVLFADLADSSGLALTLDPETFRDILRRYFDAVSTAVARHRGTVEKFVGDAIVAVFGTPTASEDDALRAARAAVEAVAAVGQLNAQLSRELDLTLGVRIGLSSGEVIVGGPREPGEPLATGAAFTIAARLQQAAPVGEVVVDELTRRLTAGAARFEPLDPVELRGVPGPIRASLLRGLVDGAPAFARRLEAPLVGRDGELTTLRAALEDVVANGRFGAVFVTGGAGIGKTRLVRELARVAGERATVVAGRCLSYGENATFQPLRDVLGSRERIAADLAGENDAAVIESRLASVFGGDATAPAEEVPWAFRRYCEVLAGKCPLVLALDDLHWAEPALLDLVEYLAASPIAAPVLMICLARDELPDTRRRFLAGAVRVALEPLSDDDTNALVEHLLEEAALEPETRDRIVAAAEGNPLFLEQLAAHVLETGVLEPPPTLRALLAARLDRLGPGERSVLERAAVVGRRLEVDDVAALLEPAAAPTLRAHLDALVGNGFLRPSPGGRFRFRHGLVHEAAYRGTPKTVRAELHERFADHLDRSAADDEVVGYHLEQAFVLRTELNAPDRLTRRLAEDAGRRLGRAGIRAWTSAEPTRVAHLLQRATALLPPDDGPRRELLCELGVALHTAGNTDAADEAFESAATAARRAGDRRVALRAELELTAAHLLDSNGEPERLLAVADDALPVFESIEDERSLGRTWMLVGWVNGGMYCRNETWRACATRALAHYRRAGFPTSTCIGHIAASSYFGPMAAREATERSLELLQSDVDDRAAEATVLAHLGGLEAMLGRFDDAFAHLAVARATYQDLLRPTAVVRTCAPIEAQSARLWGDPERASAILTESCTTLREMQNWSPLSTQAAALADALCALDRHDEALEWLEAGESCATSDDIDAQLALGAVRATILLQQGAHDEAEDTARAAVALGERTDASNRRATTLVALARVLIGVDRVDEAAGVLGQARALYEEKGNAAAVALLEATAAA